MEALLFIAFAALLVLFLSYLKVKKDIRSLKNRIHKLEFSKRTVSGTDFPADEVLSDDLLERSKKGTPVEKDPETTSNLSSELTPDTVSSSKKGNNIKVIGLFKRFEHVFIESWIAIIAVVILVAGISFFGIWASTRISPVARFTLIVFSSAVLGGLSFLSGKYQIFQPLSVWLKSAAAAVYLFAALGAGGIPGIQWIESPLMGLLMLSTGILVNLILAFIGKKQIFSSLHIILGIVAVSIAPQSVSTLIAATIVTFSGIALSYRKKWDMNHLISIIFYFGFILFWSFRVDTTNSFYSISAVSAVVVTALITLFIHYRRIYADSEFEVIPLLVHLVNWLFLSVGLLKFAPKTDYVYIPLFAAGVLLFFLARRAKKLKIRWLYATDTLISQLMILLALISLIKFDLSNMLILFLVLIESIGFLIIIWREKDFFVHTIAFSISSLVAIALLYTGLQHFWSDSHTELWIYSGLFTIAAIAMSAYILHVSGPGRGQVNTGGKVSHNILTGLHKANLLIQGAVIPLFVLGVYLLILALDTGSKYWGPDTLAVPLFIAVLAVKYRLKNWGMRFGIMVYLVLESLISISFIAFESDSSGFPLIVYYLPVILMSLSLIMYSLMKQRDIHVHVPGIYLLSIHLLFLSYFLFEDTSGLLTGFVWLILSLLYLGSSNIRRIEKLQEKMITPLKNGILNGGYLFLFAFIGRFLFFDIHSESIIFGSVRGQYLLEAVSLTVMGLWFFLNRNTRLLDLLFLELSLIFLILVLFIEVPVTILPAVFMTLSLVLLLIGRFFRNSLSRLRIVSVFPAWISAFLIAFVTSPYLAPSLSYTDTAWIMSMVGIVLQFVFLALFYKTQKIDQISLPGKLLKLEQPINRMISGKNIFLYYPVFASVLFFLIWSFNGSVLTALISIEALLILVLSIVVKEDSFRYTALGGIMACIIRLVFFDLRESDIFIKAITFIIVSVIMLLMNVLYNKFKDRIEKTD